MKAILPIITLTLAPALISTASAADNLGALKGYLPTDGTMKPGVAITPVFSPEFTKLQQEMLKKLQAQPAEKQKAFIENYNPTSLVAYDAALWSDKAAYDAYKAEWKKTKIQPVREVAVGLKEDKPKHWTVLSLTLDPQTRRSAPLTISALSYDAEKNVWISNNGELTAKSFQTTEDNLFGAQTGTEWSLTKEDSLSKLNETVRISRATDSKNVYVSYSFSERSAISNGVIAQGGYMLLFPEKNTQVNVGTPGSR